MWNKFKRRKSIDINKPLSLDIIKHLSRKDLERLHIKGYAKIFDNRVQRESPTFSSRRNSKFMFENRIMESSPVSSRKSSKFKFGGGKRSKRKSFVRRVCLLCNNT